MKDFRQDVPEFYINNNKETLVITIGDSWTWGDSLGSIPHTDTDDLDARQTQVYGKHIADELNADWINCGYCGWGNIRIIRKLYEFVSGENSNVINNMTYWYAKKDETWPKFKYDAWNYSIDTKKKISNFLNNADNDYSFLPQSKYTDVISRYKNVYYYITLTENGRDTLFYDFINTSDVYEYLQKEEEYTYRYLNHIKQKYNINLVVGRNFTVDHHTTTNSISVEKNWTQLNHNNNIHNNGISYTDITQSGAVSGVAFAHLENARRIYKTHNFTNIKEYFVDQTTQVDKLWTWLRNNGLNHNLATCHPTKESHKLWADYLLSNSRSNSSTSI
jgi:hypothetical protein